MNIFLNLDSSNFLVEYIYFDANAPEIINTDEAPFYFIENGHTNEPILLNSDDNIYTGNKREISIAEIDTVNRRFASLTPNKLGPAYQDFDTELTNSDSQDLTFNNPEGVIYDTIRLHFIQGFSFNDDFGGVGLSVKVKDKTGVPINLLSCAYTPESNNTILNPNPFLYSGRQYATYIEFKVPSLRYLISSYNIDYIGGGNSDILSYKISKGQGFYDNTLVEISAGTLKPFTKINNQLYSNLKTSESTSISAKDDFDEIGVYINDSTEGDFIEFYGTYNSEIFGDYMLRLNNSGNGNHIVIHKLVVTEQVPNTISGYNFIGFYDPLTNTPPLNDNMFLNNFNNGDYWTATETGFSAELGKNILKGDFLIYNNALPGIKIDVVSSTNIEEYSDISQFIRTSEQEFIQDSDFGEINTFRPVLKYGGSDLSFKIDYTLKIFNVNTNATVEKFGTYISFSPETYGKELIKINTRDSIKVFDIYNKKIIKTFENTGSISEETNNIEDTSIYNKNITSFKQTNNVYAGVNTISINEEGKIVPSSNPDSKESVEGQGRTTIYISPFDTFLQFNLYEQVNESINSIDLTKVGLSYLNFTNKDGEIVKIESTKNNNVDETKGQVLFRIKPSIYSQIINSGNDKFFITSRIGDNTPETVLYSGTYKDYAEQVDDEVQLLISQQRQTISDLNNEIVELETKIVEMETIGATQSQPVEKVGTTADDKSIDDKSENIKGSTFNPFN